MLSYPMPRAAEVANRDGFGLGAAFDRYSWVGAAGRVPNLRCVGSIHLAVPIVSSIPPAGIESVES
jgi:hypothetical protein